MQQDNNIINKLKELEKQQLPDLSQMENHWQQMEAMLPSANATTAKVVNINRWIWIVTSAGVIMAGILFFNQHTEKSKKETIAKAIPTNNFIIPPIDSAKIIDTSKPSNIVAVTIAANNKQESLNNLFTDVEKKAQEFIIDNRKDTTLNGAEGTSLLIPALSLGGNSEVKISLREFYKISDMILNRLTTTSNGKQLVTGGMIQVTASVNGKPVELTLGQSIRWYLPKENKNMGQMQLFAGNQFSSGVINWNAQNEYFSQSDNADCIGVRDPHPTESTRKIRKILKPGQYQNVSKQVTKAEVKVFDLRNRPFKIEQTGKGKIGYFVVTDDTKISRSELKSRLKEKYGYYKIKFRNSWRDHFIEPISDSINYSENPIGDTIWVDKAEAEKYKLPILGNRNRIYTVKDSQFVQSTDSIEVINNLAIALYNQKKNRYSGNHDTLPDKFDNGALTQKAFQKVEDRYTVNINQLGWINCDHFYTDPRQKINLSVNLSGAENYYTLLIFKNVKLVMDGIPSENQVTFSNIPIGEKVTIVSIGINKLGNPVLAMKEAEVGQKEIAGLQFEEIKTNQLKASLSKMDK